jgi:hypothetical protein
MIRMQDYIILPIGSPSWLEKLLWLLQRLLVLYDEPSALHRRQRVQ